MLPSFTAQPIAPVPQGQWHDSTVVIKNLYEMLTWYDFNTMGTSHTVRSCRPPAGSKARLATPRRVCLIPLMGCIAVATLVGVAIGSDFCAYDFPLDSNPTLISGDDICNFHQVDAQIYRGGRPRPTAFPKLVGIGIRTIIDLEGEESAAKEKKKVNELNLRLPPNKRIRFLSLPISPEQIEVTGIPTGQLKELFEQIRDTQKPIFIHCYHGKDRTGAVVAIYRMLMGQKSFDDAYKEAYHYGFSREDHGLSRTVDSYKSRKKLLSLPRPAPDQ